MKYLNSVYQKVQEAKTKKALRVLYKQAREIKDRIIDSNIPKSEKRDFLQEFKKTTNSIKIREKQLK